MKIKLLQGGFILTILSLFFYSFTQVDLSLTLSRASLYQTIEKYFQSVGYFQRPLSTEIYIAIVTLLFVFYFAFLNLSHSRAISKKTIWGLILFMSIVLTFSYNAFSYDLFNYIFDAKIITYYGANPYLHKALDYPLDPMLSFMHWTQRTYPYGPTWLALTVPLSFAGLNIFLPTFFLFKILATIGFLGSCYFIEKIVAKISPGKESFSLVFFALNPLVLIESLVSGHNDIWMMMLALFALYLFLSKLYIRSSLLLFISIGVKFATVFMLPGIIFEFLLSGGFKKINSKRLILFVCISMLAAVVAASFRTNFQPWYLLYILPFTALIVNRYYVFVPSVILSLSSLLIYIPFLSSGNWDPPIPAELFFITAAGVVLSVVIVLIVQVKNLIK